MTLFSVPPANGQESPRKKTVSGHFIAKATVSYPRSDRVEDAARWLLGKVEVAPTLKLAAETFGVQPTEVKAACRRLEQLDHANAVRLSNDVVARVIARIGPERVLKVMDRLTEPRLPFTVAAE